MTCSPSVPSQVCVLLLAVAVLACDQAPASGEGGSSAGAAAVDAADVPDVLATVGREEIRFSDLSSDARGQLAQLDNAYRRQRNDALQAAVDAAIADRLLAAEAEARDMTPAEIVAAETGPVADPTDAEVQAWYTANRARLQGRSLDQLREQIREFLRQSRVEEQTEALDRRLREKYDVTVRVDPFRVSLDNAGSPAFGPEDAPVTLVEFSDFECPFCGRFVPTLDRVKEEYSDRVRIVYRQFPIPSLHPAAFKASEASLCAHEQGEFWAYHDLLFEEQDRLTVRDLKEKAGRLGLDQAAFDECLDTGRYVEQVQEDQAEGQAAGVGGTPALFVNGIPVEGGAVAYDSLASALDAELARRGS